jgi:hypothetical protein
LREAVKQARVEEAGQLDQAADRRDSEMARLELLKTELQSVFAEIDGKDDRFTLTLVPSRPARLWIDLFTYAAIDDQSGAYLFIRNNESGRRTLFSSPQVSEMADRITSYMAREIVRRERQEAALLEPLREVEAPLQEPPPKSGGHGLVLAAFIVGLLTGAAALFVMAWVTLP